MSRAVTSPLAYAAQLITQMKVLTAVCTFCWAIVLSVGMGVLIMPWELPAAAACTAWMMRFVRHRRERNDIPLVWHLLPTCGLLFLATRGLSPYELPYFFPAFAAHFCLTFFIKTPPFRRMGQSISMAFCCAAPAAAYSFDMSLFSQLVYPPVWLLAALLWLQGEIEADTSGLRWQPLAFCIVLMLICGTYLICFGNESESCSALLLMTALMLTLLGYLIGKRFCPALTPLAASPLLSAAALLLIAWALNITQLI